VFSPPPFDLADQGTLLKNASSRAVPPVTANLFAAKALTPPGRPGPMYTRFEPASAAHRAKPKWGNKAKEKENGGLKSNYIDDPSRTNQ